MACLQWVVSKVTVYFLDDHGREGSTCMGTGCVVLYILYTMQGQLHGYVRLQVL